MKYAILAGAASMTIVAAIPAEAAQNSDDRGTVQGWAGSDADRSGYGSGANIPRAQKKPAGKQSASNGYSTGGTVVPEPSNLLMLGLGLAGLIAGRMVARRRKKT